MLLQTPSIKRIPLPGFRILHLGRSLAHPKGGILSHQARQICSEVSEAIATWRDAANNRGIKTSEITRFEDAFDTSLLP